MSVTRLYARLLDAVTRRLWPADEQILTAARYDPELWRRLAVLTDHASTDAATRGRRP